MMPNREASASDAALYRRGRNKGFKAAIRAMKRAEAENRQVAYNLRQEELKKENEFWEQHYADADVVTDVTSDSSVEDVKVFMSRERPARTRKRTHGGK